MHLNDLGMKATHLIRDRDKKFLCGFDDILRSEGIVPVVTSIEAPEMNGYAESFVGTIKRECLDYFIAFSYNHLMHLLQQYQIYYNSVRPHRGLDNHPIGLSICDDRAPNFDAAQVACDEWLGGRLRHYRWAQAA
jgi:putative transposase